MHCKEAPLILRIVWPVQKSPEVDNNGGISISCEISHLEHYVCLKFYFEDANQVCRGLLLIFQLEDGFDAQKG